MWLTLDIGNSSIKGALFDGERLARTFRIAPRGDASPNDVSSLLMAYLNGVSVSHAGICSVVPERTQVVAAAAAQIAGAPPLLIHAGMPLPFELAYDTPQTLGVDRLAAAAAGWVMYGPSHPGHAVVVVDAGTAVTYEVVEPPGRYVGGAIAPGPELLKAALHNGTAQLPDVPMELPATAIGRSTREAIQAGVMYGFVDAARGMLARIGDQFDRRPIIIATGGWGARLKDHLEEIRHVEPDLVLHGIRILMEQSL